MQGSMKTERAFGIDSFHLNGNMSFSERGFECGDGWFDLIFKLCEDIEKLKPENFKAVQIKEKFGGLRFYCVYSGGAGIEDLLSKAEDDSYKTCEYCGSKENVTSEGSWIVTLCDKCRKPK